MVETLCAPVPGARVVVVEDVSTRLEELRALYEQLELRVVERTATLAAKVIVGPKSEERELELNRVLRASRSANQRIAREKDPARLVEQGCQEKGEAFHAGGVDFVRTILNTIATGPGTPC